jgi:hypothetical protein
MRQRTQRRLIVKEIHLYKTWIYVYNSQFRLISSEFWFKLINICIPYNSQQTIKYSLETASILFARLDDLLLCWFSSRKHITNQPYVWRELRSIIVVVWKTKLDSKAWNKAHISILSWNILFNFKTGTKFEFDPGQLETDLLKLYTAS